MPDDDVVTYMCALTEAYSGAEGAQMVLRARAKAARAAERLKEKHPDKDMPLSVDAEEMYWKVATKHLVDSLVDDGGDKARKIWVCLARILTERPSRSWMNVDKDGDDSTGGAKLKAVQAFWDRAAFHQYILSLVDFVIFTFEQLAYICRHFCELRTREALEATEPTPRQAKIRSFQIPGQRPVLVVTQEDVDDMIASLPPLLTTLLRVMQVKHSE